MAHSALSLAVTLP